jgi:hypothetical protein
VWPGAAEAVRGIGLRADGAAGPETDVVRGLSERMLEKLAQLARFGLTAGQPLFRASRRHA